MWSKSRYGFRDAVPARQASCHQPRWGPSAEGGGVLRLGARGSALPLTGVGLVFALAVGVVSGCGGGGPHRSLDYSAGARDRAWHEVLAARGLEGNQPAAVVTVNSVHSEDGLDTLTVTLSISPDARAPVSFPDSSYGRTIYSYDGIRWNRDVDSDSRSLQVVVYAHPGQHVGPFFLQAEHARFHRVLFPASSRGVAWGAWAEAHA